MMYKLRDYNIEKVKKKLFDNYTIVPFSYGYRKRRKIDINFLIKATFVMTFDELEEFRLIYNEQLLGGTELFISHNFEIDEKDIYLEDGFELDDVFVYKFFKDPEFKRVEGEMYKVDIEIVKVDATLCDSVFNNIFNNLNFIGNILTKEEKDGIIDLGFQSCNTEIKALTVYMSETLSYMENLNETSN